MRRPEQKSVLVVAYHAPPDSAIGARRTEKFVRYLSQFGWTPHVLTVMPRYYEQVDKTSPKWPPEGAAVTRTAMIPSLGWAYRALKQLFSKRSEAPDEMRVGTETKASRPKPAWRRVLLSLLLVPDDKQGWFPFGIISGLQIIRKYGIRCIYSSGPPWTTHLIAMGLSLLTGLPWAADFRDPWSTHYFKPPYSTSRLSRGLEAGLRNQVYRRARAIVLNTPQAKERFAARFPQFAAKLTAITNGYDISEVAAAPACPVRESNGPLLFLHAGTLFPQRDPREFLEILRRLYEDGTLRPQQLNVEFLGTMELESTETLRLIDEVSKMGWLSVRGPVGREECLTRMRTADVLLLFDKERPTQAPGKLFDYLPVGIPILAVVDPDSAGAEIVRRTSAGIVADWRDSKGLREAILQIVDLSSHRDGRFSPDKKEIAGYDVRQLTRSLAEVLNAITLPSAVGGGDQ